MRASFLSTVGICSLGVLFACSSNGRESNASNGQTGTGGLHLSTTGTGASGGSTFVSGDSGQCQPVINGCSGSVYATEVIPLDIYVMFDQSGSMLCPAEGPCLAPADGGTSRMAGVRGAVEQFLSDPQSTGLGVGIGYFGYQQIGSLTCNTSDYSTPSVGIGVLPGNTTALTTSLDAIQPTGETPTGAAIRGACTYASSWKASHRAHQVVILLVTDGVPEAPVSCNADAGGGCCPTLPDAVAAATECNGGPTPLKTYVLGVGPSLDNLGQIAIAGGTSAAYLVSSGDVTSQVLAALNAIRAAATIPCQLKMPPPPPGEQLDYGLVNLVYSTAECQATTLLNSTTLSGCDPNSGGWYYDNPSAPTQVELCPTSCDQVKVPGGQLMFSVGCTTEFLK